MGDSYRLGIDPEVDENFAAGSGRTLGGGCNGDAGWRGKACQANDAREVSAADRGEDAFGEGALDDYLEASALEGTGMILLETHQAKPSAINWRYFETRNPDLLAPAGQDAWAGWHGGRRRPAAGGNLPIGGRNDVFECAPQTPEEEGQQRVCFEQPEGRGVGLKSGFAQLPLVFERLAQIPGPAGYPAPELEVQLPVGQNLPMKIIQNVPAAL